MYHAFCRIPAAAWPGVLFLCVLAASCGRPSNSPLVTEVDSAGVRIVTSHGEGWAGDPDWHLELDLDVGDLDGPNAFARLRDVAERSTGGMWVLDSQARRVRGFDDAGNEVLAFGRAGQGPGEFTFVDHVAELPDGGLLVGGSGPIVLHRFGRDGSHRNSMLIPDSVFRERPKTRTSDGPPAGPSFGRWRVSPGGSVFVQTVVMDAEGENIVRSDALFRLVPEGGRATRLAQWNTSLMEGGPGGTMRLLRPDAGWSPLADGGAWFTPGSVYELRQLDRTGRVTTLMRRPVPRLPVTEAIRLGVRARLDRTMDSEFERGMLDRAVYPAYLPATFGLWGGDSGALWVGVVDPAFPWDYERANAWDIFELDGGYVGRLPIPVGLRPTRVTRDHVYGIWLDDLDVPHARRYSIVRPGS
ncbi:MAG: hypothetical protein ACE5FP_07210 [Gemmatimonadota bacterium]